VRSSSLPRCICGSRRSCRRAGPVGLLEAVIAAVEARDHAGTAVAEGSRHRSAPAFRCAILGLHWCRKCPQIMQGAEDLGQPLQVAVERRGGVLGPRRPRLHAEMTMKAARKCFDMKGSRTPLICLFNTLEARRGGFGTRPELSRSYPRSTRRADWMTSWRPPVSLRSLKPSGGSHRKSSSSSFRTGSPEVQRAANDMIR